jgi:hypothetical protein
MMHSLSEVLIVVATLALVVMSWIAMIKGRHGSPRSEEEHMRGWPKWVTDDHHEDDEDRE